MLDPETPCAMKVRKVANIAVITNFSSFILAVVIHFDSLRHHLRDHSVYAFAIS